MMKIGKIIFCLFFVKTVVGITQLQQKYSWPNEKPSVSKDPHGWFHPSNRLELNKILHKENVHIIVELGSWLGKSTLFLLKQAPQAVVVAVDHWKGSTEHFTKPKIASKIPTLYKTFLVNCWEYKDRLIPMRTTTQLALDELFEYKINIDLFYIDASHDYKSVTQDLEKVNEYFPNAIITGDDWSWESVRKAVQDFVKKYSFKINANGNFYRIIK